VDSGFLWPQVKTVTREWHLNPTAPVVLLGPILEICAIRKFRRGLDTGGGSDIVRSRTYVRVRHGGEDTSQIGQLCEMKCCCQRQPHVLVRAEFVPIGSHMRGGCQCQAHDNCEDNILQIRFE
jgi:hypothetical protein